MGNIDGLREQVEQLKQRLNEPQSQAHPYLVSSAMVLNGGWEYGRKGPWLTDQRQVPDFPPFDIAVTAIRERVGISQGRSRESSYWTTYGRDGREGR